MLRQLTSPWTSRGGVDLLYILRRVEFRVQRHKLAVVEAIVETAHVLLDLRVLDVVYIFRCAFQHQIVGLEETLTGGYTLVLMYHCSAP